MKIVFMWLKRSLKKKTHTHKVVFFPSVLEVLRDTLFY